MSVWRAEEGWMPTSTAEDYLRCILLEEQRDPDARVGTGRLAEQLSLSPGTVTAMVQSLAESGLVVYERYVGVRLTDAGRRAAMGVLRRHRLIELFLVEVVGLDWSEVHGEADRLEHAFSERLVATVDELLGYPAIDPHGDPIPDAAGRMADLRRASLVDCPVERDVWIARLDDQSEGFLRLAGRYGLKPGRRVRVVARDLSADLVTVVGDAETKLSLGLRAARKIQIDTSQPDGHPEG
jgi:DtxR family Mn-dependent transcriptional regulator